MKKAIVYLGIMSVLFLVISNATAVPQTQSKYANDLIDKISGLKQKALSNKLNVEDLEDFKKYISENPNPEPKSIIVLAIVLAILSILVPFFAGIFAFIIDSVITFIVVSIFCIIAFIIDILTLLFSI